MAFAQLENISGSALSLRYLDSPCPYAISTLYILCVCVVGTVDVEISTPLYKDLCLAQQALCVQNYLHLIYLISPYELLSQVKPDWSLLFHLVSV